MKQMRDVLISECSRAWQVDVFPSVRLSQLLPQIPVLLKFLVCLPSCCLSAKKQITINTPSLLHLLSSREAGE